MSQIPTPSSRVLAIEDYSLKARCTDYVELSKMRIAVMVLITVAIGFLLGSGGLGNWVQLLHAMLGIGMVAAASSMFNQVFEQKTDALMPRTQNRPLPSGRVSQQEVMFLGFFCVTYGTLHLFAFVNLITALLTLLTLVMYVGIYTPLKLKTSVCTAIGAIPGALPPVLGWAASGQPLGWEAFFLFAIMFLWQFPHFFAIAWMYREQYAQAGLHMLPNQLPKKYLTGMMAVTYAAILLPISLLPSYVGMAGPVYFTIALVMGLIYLTYSIRFLRDECRTTARKLLFCSLFYLPIILISLTVSALNQPEPGTSLTTVSQPLIDTERH